MSSRGVPKQGKGNAPCMLQGWLGHHARCLWILDGFRFGWHRCAIDAGGARARIARCDCIERRAGLEALGLLDGFIESSGLLHEPLHLLGGEDSPEPHRGDRIVVDGAVGRGWRRGRERGG